MALRTYTPVGPFYRCSECPPTPVTDEAGRTTARYVDVIDADTHDRWHAERAAAADPGQTVLFG